MVLSTDTLYDKFNGEKIPLQVSIPFLFAAAERLVPPPLFCRGGKERGELNTSPEKWRQGHCKADLEKIVRESTFAAA